MSGSDIYVSFGADVSALTQAMDQVRANMTALNGDIAVIARSMSDAGDAAQGKLAGGLTAVGDHYKNVAAQQSQFLQGLRTVNVAAHDSVAAHEQSAQALQHIGDAAKAATEGLHSIQSALRRVAELAGVTFSVSALKSWAEETIKSGAELDNQAAKTGASLQDIQQLNGIAKISGASGDELISSLHKLQGELRKSDDDAEKTVAAFKAIGLSFDEMKTKNPFQLLEAIAGAFSRYSDGANKTAVANKLLGSAGEDMIRTLDLGRAAFVELEAAVLRAGNSMSDATIDALGRTQRDLNELKYAWNSAMFAGVVPSVDVGIRAITRLVEAIDANTIRTALDVVVDQFIDFGGKVAEALLRAQNSWDQFVRHIDAGAPSLSGNAKKYSDKALGFLNSVSGADGRNAYASTPEAIGDSIGLKIAEGLHKVGLASQATIDKWRELTNAANGVASTAAAAFGGLDVASIKTELAVQKVRDATNQAKSSFDRLSGAVSTAHSDAALGGNEYYGNAKSRLGSPNGPPAGVIPGDADDDAAGKAKGDAGAVAEATYRSEAEAAARAAREIEQKQNQLLQSHKIGMHDWLTASTAALDQEQDAVQDAADRALASGVLTSKQKIDVAREEERQIGEIAERMSQDQQKAAEDTQKWWDASANQIESSFNSQLRPLLSGTENFANAFKKVIGDAVIAVIEGFENFAVEAVLQYTVIDHAAGLSAALQVAAQQTAASGGIAALVGNAVKAVTIDAGQTFAGVAAFLSPFLGPAALGPAAAAQATVLGAVASADVGMWSVPADMLTLVHHNELIMPAAQSEAFRNLLSSGAPAGAGGPSVSVSPQMNVHVHANDGASVAQWARDNSGDLAKAIHEAARHGVLLGMRRFAT